MTRVGSLTVDLRTNVAKFAQGMDRANGYLSKFSRQADAAKRGLSGLLAIGGAAGIGFGIFKGISSTVKAAVDLEQQMNKLNGLLKATGNASKYTGGELDDLARSLDKSTLASAQSIRDAEGILLTFKSVSGDVFKRTIELAQDMSTVMGVDVKSSVLQLAKALEEPAVGLTYLRRSGVSFTQAEQDQIKALAANNQLLDAQKLILDKVAGQMGGAAQAAASGFAGTIDRLSYEWRNFLENLGDSTAFKIAQDAIHELASGIASISNFINRDKLGAQALEKFNTLLKPNVDLLKKFGIYIYDIDPTNLNEVNFALDLASKHDLDLKLGAQLFDIQHKIIGASEALRGMNIVLSNSEDPRALSNAAKKAKELEDRIKALVKEYQSIAAPQAAITSGPNLAALKVQEKIIADNLTANEKLSNEILRQNAYWLAGITTVEQYAEAIQKAAGYKDSQGADPLKSIRESLYSDKKTLALQLQERSQLVAEQLLGNEPEIIQERNALLIGLYSQYEQQLTALTAQEAQKRIQLEQQAADAQMSLKQGVVDNAVGLFQSLGSEQKAFAKLAIIITKGQAIAQALAYSQVAAVLAYSSQLIPGDPTSYGRAAAAYTHALSLGKISAGLIAATGLSEIASLNRSPGGGAPAGSPANPINVTQGNISSQQTFTRTDEQAKGVVVKFEINGPTDPQAMQRWIDSSRGQIIDLVQTAYDQRGAVGGPRG